MTRYKSCFSFQTIRVNSSPTFITLIKADGAAEEAWLTLQGGDIRYRYDGGNPSALEGHLLTSGSSLRLHGQNQVSSFRAIACTENEGILSVSYERD